MNAGPFFIFQELGSVFVKTRIHWTDFHWYYCIPLDQFSNQMDKTFHLARKQIEKFDFLSYSFILFLLSAAIRDIAKLPSCATADPMIYAQTESAVS